MKDDEDSLMLLKKLFYERLEEVRLVVTDFDGVHTDGFMYVNQWGAESVRCSRRDGLGIHMLKNAGIEVCVISNEENDVVLKRCAKLKIEYHHGILDGQGKADILKRICLEKKISLKNVLYMGDDVNDIPAMRIVGIAVSVPDCHMYVEQLAHYITTKNGGDGAIREVCELILLAQGKEIKF